MPSATVILRDMRPDEFDAYIALHLVSYPRAAYGTMPPEAARERVR